MSNTMASPIKTDLINEKLKTATKIDQKGQVTEEVTSPPKLAIAIEVASPLDADKKPLEMDNASPLDSIDNAPEIVKKEPVILPTMGIDEVLLHASAARESKEEINVDEMKIQTMYKMVEDVNVDIGGKQVVKKVLYLTNKQAALFDDEAMARCIQALDIGEPKFVIKLCASPGVRSQSVISHSELKGTAYAEFNAFCPYGHLSCEIDKSDEGVVESQILLFMKTCILPLAKQTHALILITGANDCYLSAG